MKVVIDAMGGDRSPLEPVKGAVQAFQEKLAEITLVGDEERIREIMKEYAGSLPIPIIHTDEFIDMHESPSAAVKKKKKSSMIVCAQTVKSGQADAMISAGNTGALFEVATLYLGRLPGIKRPALSVLFPVRTGHCLFLDAGANADCRPEHLLHFAIMGSIYAESVMGRPNPRVGLFNIGQEEGKGNALVLGAYELLQHSRLNFIGNIEPGGFIEGNADVVVADGFTGNIMLKTAESVAGFLFGSIKEEIGRRSIFKAAALMMKSAFRRVKTKLDHSEYGGSQLLGLRGICIKAHGSADARTIRNAVKVAVRVGEGKVQELIAERLKEGREPAVDLPSV